jgi:DNA transformation protein and related proteins
MNDFVATVLDLLRPWGGVAARRMFGGHGLYRQGVMFGLVSDDALYLKVDDRNRPAFEAAGMGPFTYETKSGTITIGSYYEAPAALFDEAEEMLAWVRPALDAALRTKAGTKPAKRAKSRKRRITKS